MDGLSIYVEDRPPGGKGPEVASVEEELDWVPAEEFLRLEQELSHLRGILNRKWNRECCEPEDPSSKCGGCFRCLYEQARGALEDEVRKRQELALEYEKLRKKWESRPLSKTITTGARPTEADMLALEAILG